MEKILKYFRTYPILKILGSFGLMFLICWLFDITDWNVFKYLIWVPGVYLIALWVSLVVLLVRIIRNERYDKKHKGLDDLNN